jgi:hypothetical protein
MRVEAIVKNRDVEIWSLIAVKVVMMETLRVRIIVPLIARHRMERAATEY